jgi:hypothetical protein
MGSEMKNINKEKIDLLISTEMNRKEKGKKG